MIPRNKHFHMINRIKVKLYIILLATSLLSLQHANAQDYRLLDPNRKLTFARVDESLYELDSIYYFMEVDSVTTNDLDSIFYFNQQLKASDPPTCDFLNTDTILLGTKVLVLPDTDRTYVFFNSNNDSIFIKSKIVLGDTWKVYKWPDGSYVKATVVSNLLRTILPGIEDSLYRIQLNVFSAAGIMQLETFPNATKLDITKGHGISEVYNFNIFPLPGDSAVRKLRGLDNPDEAIVDIDAQNAFNFELGYEFHYREEVAPDPTTSSDKRISAWKYFVLSKSSTSNDVTYDFERIKFDTLISGITTTTAITWDTVTVTYNYADYAFLDTIEFNVFQAERFGYSDWNRNDTIYNGVPYKTVYDWFEYDEATKCLSNPVTTKQPEQVFGDGIGILHYLDSTDIDDYYLLEMVYFQKGFITWGTPYDFSAFDNAVEDVNSSNVNVYPNPAVNFIWVENFTPGAQVTIFDVNGKLALMSNQSENKIDISSLNPGCYFIVITSCDGIHYSKFIKTNF